MPKTIMEVVTEAKLDIYPSGDGRWKAICPFHNEKEPSLVVYEDENTYRCYGCVEGNSEVITKQGFFKIRDVVPGMSILGSGGEFKTVLNIWKTNKTDRLSFNFHNRNIPLKVTPEHKMLIIQPSKNNGRNVLDTNLMIECFAKDVRIGDYMLTPKPKLWDFNSLDEWDISKYIKQHGRENKAGLSGKPIPNKFLIDSDLLWLIGMYVAEGSCSSNRVLGFSLNINESDFAERICHIIKNKFDVVGRMCKRPNRGSIDVTFCNVFLVDLFSGACGRKSFLKHFPYELLFCADKSMLHAALEGDGCKRIGRTVLTVVSREFAWQTYYMHCAFGNTPSIHHKDAYIYKTVNHRERYTVSIGTGKNKIGRLSNDTFYGFRVTSIEKEIGNEDTYDLSVDGGQFVVDGVLVHNCNAGSTPLDFVKRFYKITYDQAKKIVEGPLEDSDLKKKLLTPKAKKDNFFFINISLANHIRDIFQKNKSNRLLMELIFDYLNNCKWSMTIEDKEMFIKGLDKEIECHLQKDK